MKCSHELDSGIGKGDFSFLLAVGPGVVPLTINIEAVGGGQMGEQGGHCQPCPRRLVRWEWEQLAGCTRSSV